jgi:glutamate 5-kinase
VAESKTRSGAAQTVNVVVDPREALKKARRIVVKIGSKTLAQDSTVFSRLAHDIRELHGLKRKVVLVSSGAIALGVAKLGLRTRPKEMAWLQAAAAAGQSVLMGRYEEAFQKVGIPVAQVLLTHADLADRARGNNARGALGALLEAGALPIINENDTVAVEEIRFGDNDQLASMVVPLVDGDLLLLLSDVEGLLNAGRRVPIVNDVDDEALPLVGKSTSGVGTGGMGSKLEAARKATRAGAHVVIADAREPGVLGAITRGEDKGTLFVPQGKRLSARHHWIAFTLRPKGALLLDAGAVEAVRRGGKSLLPIGTLGVRGDFSEGEAVELLDGTGKLVARGLARFSAAESARLAGRKTEGPKETPLVHRTDLVVV